MQDVEMNIMKVLFNVFILNTLDMMKFESIARNSCEIKLVTLPIKHIRNVIKTWTPPRPKNEVLQVYLRYLLAKCIFLSSYYLKMLCRKCLVTLMNSFQRWGLSYALCSKSAEYVFGFMKLMWHQPKICLDQVPATPLIVPTYQPHQWFTFLSEVVG